MNNVIYDFTAGTVEYVSGSLWHNGIYLLLSIGTAVAMTVYIDAKKARKFLMKRSRFVIPASVLIAALTPLCACGTMAVVISLLSSAFPLGAVMSFLVSSPLMSPDTFILVSGFMGLKFTIILAVSSLVMGFASGYLTQLVERRSNLLKNQLRTAEPEPAYRVVYQKEPESCGCQSKLLIQTQTPEVVLCCSGNQTAVTCACPDEKPILSPELRRWTEKLKLKQFAKEFYKTGILKIVPLFVLFVAIAYWVKTYVPTEWIIALFSGDHFYSVPLAAVVGIPLYISDATVVPLLQVLKDAGASNGALLAFMIAGPGTSLGVIGGLMLIIKRRLLWLYLGYIFIGAIVLGYLTDLVL